MKIRLLAFATAGDAVGEAELEISLPDGSSIHDLRQELNHRYPELGDLWPRLAVALDGELVSQEAVLYDGAEVALLPPVSGGSGEASPGPDSTPRVALVDGPIDGAGLQRTVSGPRDGAVVVFVGTVRNHHRGRAVHKITYSAYRSMAVAKLRDITQELSAGRDELKIGIHHRLGEIAVGEASVVIAVAAPHRAAAYEVNRRALERLKAEVPIWKQEHYADGQVAWREEEPLKPSTAP